MNAEPECDCALDFAEQVFEGGVGAGVGVGVVAGGEYVGDEVGGAGFGELLKLATEG